MVIRAKFNQAAVTFSSSIQPSDQLLSNNRSAALFVANEEQQTLIDVERGFELVINTQPTGSSGYHSFLIMGRETSFHFYARTSSSPIADDEDPLSTPRDIVWNVMGQSSNDRQRAIIVEALKAYKHRFGLTRDNWRFTVAFESDSRASQKSSFFQALYQRLKAKLKLQ